MERTFTVVIEPSSDGRFEVMVPALPEAGTGGATPQEAVAKAKQSIARVLAFRLARGIPIPADTQREWLSVTVAEPEPMASVRSLEDQVDLHLTSRERRFLYNGLTQWGGPARCTSEMARAIGFINERDLLDLGYVLAQRIEAGEALSINDWKRVLLATEIVYASNVIGAAWDWSIVSGFDDVESLQLLRGIQRKYTKAYAV